MPSRPSDQLGLSMKSIASVAVKSDTAANADAPCTLDRPVKLRITCMNIRHKLMYVDERHAQRGMVDVNSDSRVYWCAMTQGALGPDNRPVHPGDCSNGRECYCHSE